MAYDEDLADRVRELVAGESGMTEKPMFGGLAMLRNGHMAVVIRGRGGLMIRCDPADRKALAEPGVEPAEMRGRTMTGWVVVTGDAVAKMADLRRWVKRGMSAAGALEPK